MKNNQNLLVILIILVTLDLATNIFTFVKINNDFSEEKISMIVKQSIIDSQKELAKELLNMVGFNPEKLKEDSERAKLSSLKSNMHTFQTAVETYAVDWGGLYPESVEVLKQEATQKDYWKELRNPFNSYNNVHDNYSNYSNSSNKISFNGAVLYEPLITGDSITSYNIRGIDDKSALIDLVLTNQ